MARSTTIDTVRLRIEPFTEQYLTLRYVSWLNDHEVVRFSEQRFKTHSFESCRDYMQSFEGTANYFWAIEVRNSSFGHIGTMNAYVDEVNQVADVGILIGEKRARQQGFGLEAWCAVCKWLLDKSGMRKVTAGTLSVNESMLGLISRSGMVEDGRRIKQCLFEGKEVDVIYNAFFMGKKQMTD
jgi:ribosomal-protein-alanine N-acetyltransferase